MNDEQPTPLQAAFWFTDQEKRYVLIICGLILLGLATRYFYLKSETSKLYTPATTERTEPTYE